jgi:DnaA family protein
MQQLVLALNVQSAPTLASFVTGRNAELLAVLQETGAGQPYERFLYLWGDHGAGKSHLLQALTANRGTLVAASMNQRLDAELAETPLLAVDDVDMLDDAGAIDLFNIYNRMREIGGILLASGKCPPTQLKLRPDLVTRLAWGLVFQVHPLTDEEKIAALQSHAKTRGFQLSDEVGQYLLTHWHRDMASLFAALDELDRYSLETKRPITVPLLRDAIGLNLRKTTKS